MARLYILFVIPLQQIFYFVFQGIINLVCFKEQELSKFT